MVGLDLKGLFQPKRCYDAVILTQAILCSVPIAPASQADGAAQKAHCALCLWPGPSRGAEQRAPPCQRSRSPPARGSGVAGHMGCCLETPWHQDLSLGCTGKMSMGMPWRDCETCGCKAHTTDGATGETPLLSTGSLWLLACLSRDGHWCPLLLLGTCVTRFGGVGNEAGHFGQGRERMTQGGGLFPCCWLFRRPLATPILLPLLPRSTPTSQGLQSPWGAASPRGVIPC